jgi:hypothetical protein
LLQVGLMLEPVRAQMADLLMVAVREVAPPDSPKLQAWHRRLAGLQQLPRSQLWGRRAWEQTARRELLPELLGWAALAEGGPRQGEERDTDAEMRLRVPEA